MHVTHGFRITLRRHHGWLLPMLRGVTNAGAVAFALRQGAHPLPAALAAGGAAGVQSALLQLSPINARYARYLNRAGSEPMRFLRWAAVATFYCGVMQLAGALASGAALRPGPTLLLAIHTSVLGSAQYPFMAAIARLRGRAERRRQCPERIRLHADLATLVVSAFFVSLSALAAIQHGASHVVLVVAGLVGLVSYVHVRWPGRFGAALAAQTSSFSMRAVDG
jgi:hypothetical protein